MIFSDFAENFNFYFFFSGNHESERYNDRRDSQFPPAVPAVHTI